MKRLLLWLEPRLQDTCVMFAVIFCAANASFLSLFLLEGGGLASHRGLLVLAAATAACCLLLALTKHLTSSPTSDLLNPTT